MNANRMQLQRKSRTKASSSICVAARKQAVIKNQHEHVLVHTPEWVSIFFVTF